MIRLGYNTNGLAHHRLPDALSMIADVGYRAVAITLDVPHLDPYLAHHAARCFDIATQLRDLGLEAIVETGARFLLDPRHKHQPTLLSASASDRARRVDFLRRAIDTAVHLGSEVVSLWSGTPDDDADPDELDDRLVEGLEQLIGHGVTLGFEPEPGMFIEDLDGYMRIRDRVPALRLTLDVGHALLTEDSVERTIEAFVPEIVNVHLEGMRRGVHDHLVPWEGDLDVPAALRALGAAGYDGPACLELSRHSHDAVRVARRAFELLAPALSW